MQNVFFVFSQCMYCDALRDLVPFKQFKKRSKSPNSPLCVKLWRLPLLQYPISLINAISLTYEKEIKLSFQKNYLYIYNCNSLKKLLKQSKTLTWCMLHLLFCYVRPWNLYLYLSIYLSIYPSIHPSIHPSIYLSLYIWLIPK